MKAKNMNAITNSKMRKEKTIAALAVYAVAMALVEAAVVVYLRELYYPAGFFIQTVADLQVIPWKILRVELWREIATIVMLVSIAFLAFERVKEKLLAFVWAFSLWDLFYYLFLYIFLGWPPSFKTLDIYFLIPWPWIGSVWSPLILFSILAVISLYLLLKNNTKNR